MSETVECSECRTRYDSQEHPFCPRCGSTSRGVPLPGALASARRNDPARRRVQASGAVLLAIGVLFLVASVASVLVPPERAAESVLDVVADQPGGALTVRWPSEDPATLRLVALDREELANVSVEGGKHSANLTQTVVEVHATQGNLSWNRTVVVPAGGSLVLDLPSDPTLGAGDPVFSPVYLQVLAVTRYVSVGLAVALCASGACAITLRLWPIAALGAIIGMALGLFTLFAFLVLGLLFALPFWVCGVLILRGRRHFRRPKGPDVPPGPPPVR